MSKSLSRWSRQVGIATSLTLLFVATVQLGCPTSESETAFPLPVADVLDEGSFDVGSEDLHVGPTDVADAALEPTIDLPAEASDAGTDSPDDRAGDGDVNLEISGPVRYSEGRIHSPITPFVIDRLQEIQAMGSGLNPAVFMKVGDSITIDPNFLRCLADGEIDLTDHSELEDTLETFRSGDAAGTTPFDRPSEVALGGQTASWAITGDPSPAEREIAAIHPQIAVVMFGTNDMGWYPLDMPRMFRWYGNAYLTLIDDLLRQGIIPILSSIPPRENNAFLDLWVPTVNQFVRAVAQTRQIPFVDFHLALQPLPGFGLKSDGVHPNAASTGACDFSPNGLEHGQNMRNLTTLQVLDRLRETVFEGEAAPETDVWVIEGSGTTGEPYVIDELPFSDWRDTTTSSSDVFDSYPSCSSGADESGPEVVYQLNLSAAVRLRAMVLDVGDVDIDIHLLEDLGGGESCLARNDTLVQGTLGPGTFYLVADTYVSSVGEPYVGEFLLVVTTCEDDDDACDDNFDP